MYALNLADDRRILSACVVRPDGNYDGMVLVGEFPDGNLYEYRYMGGKFIHDPLPKPEQHEEDKPTQEERIAALEAAMTAIEEGIASV